MGEEWGIGEVGEERDGRGGGEEEGGRAGMKGKFEKDIRNGGMWQRKDRGRGRKEEER